MGCYSKIESENFFWEAKHNRYEEQILLITGTLCKNRTYKDKAKIIKNRGINFPLAEICFFNSNELMNSKSNLCRKKQD